jgi:hypothetical protein
VHPRHRVQPRHAEARHRAPTEAHARCDSYVKKRHFFQYRTQISAPRDMPIPGLPGVTDFTLFGGLNVCVVGWALLACPPSWRPKRWKAVVLGLCFVFGVLYVVTLANALVTGLVPEQAGFGTLDGVTELFKVREVVFSGWTHFVCHDLLVGVWVAEDSQKRYGWRTECHLNLQIPVGVQMDFRRPHPTPH